MVIVGPIFSSLKVDICFFWICFKLSEYWCCLLKLVCLTDTCVSGVIVDKFLFDLDWDVEIERMWEFFGELTKDSVDVVLRELSPRLVTFANVCEVLVLNIAVAISCFIVCNFWCANNFSECVLWATFLCYVIQKQSRRALWCHAHFIRLLRQCTGFAICWYAKR